MLLKKLFQSRFTSSVAKEVKSFEDSMELLSMIPTGKKFQEIETVTIKECCTWMEKSKDVRILRKALIDRFKNDFRRLNNSMAIMELYLDAVSLDDVENLEQALIVCEEVPHEIISTDYCGDMWYPNDYDGRAIAKAAKFATDMFEEFSDFNESLKTLDQIIGLVNRHSGFRGSDAVLDSAFGIINGYIICLDQAILVLETYKRCGCVSFSALNQIEDKYLAIGSGIIDSKKSIDDLIVSMNTIPNLRSNLFDYIIEKINKVGMTLDLGSIETRILVSYDRQIPEGNFKTAIRDELIARLDTTKK